MSNAIIMDGCAILWTIHWPTKVNVLIFLKYINNIMYFIDKTQRPLLGVRWVLQLPVQHQKWSTFLTKTKIHTWQSCNMTSHDDVLYKYARVSH